jgi:hypothetical protein
MQTLPTISISGWIDPVAMSAASEARNAGTSRSPSSGARSAARTTPRRRSRRLTADAGARPRLLLRRPGRRLGGARRGARLAAGRRHRAPGPGHTQPPAVLSPSSSSSSCGSRRAATPRPARCASAAAPTGAPPAPVRSASACAAISAITPGSGPTTRRMRPASRCGSTMATRRSRRCSGSTPRPTSWSGSGPGPGSLPPPRSSTLARSARSACSCRSRRPRCWAA